MDNYIDIKNLSKSYESNIAIDDLSLDLAKGKIYGLIGPNGSGKTSLLKVIAGISKVDKGRINISGKPINFSVKNDLAFLADRPFLYDDLKTKDNFDLFDDFYDDFDKERAARLMEYFYINEKAKPSSLSKGDYKKLAISLILSRDADLYLLDEPSNGLDSISIAKLQDLLIEMFDGKKTFIIATHQIDLMENLFEELIFLEKGKLHHRNSARNIRDEHGTDIYDFYDQIYLG